MVRDTHIKLSDSVWLPVFSVLKWVGILSVPTKKKINLIYPDASKRALSRDYVIVSWRYATTGNISSFRLVWEELQFMPLLSVLSSWAVCLLISESRIIRNLP